MNTDTPTPAHETHAEFAAGLTAPAAKPTTRNVLGTRQIVHLWDWCEKNKASLPTLPNPQLAQIAAAELQFPVTPANIANMLAEMHIEKRKPDAPPTLEEKLQHLTDRVARLESFLAFEQPLTPGEAFITGAPLPPPADHPELPITAALAAS